MKIKLLIKFTKEEIKLYKEIKNTYPQKDFRRVLNKKKVLTTLVNTFFLSIFTLRIVTTS